MSVCFRVGFFVSNQLQRFLVISIHDLVPQKTKVYLQINDKLMTS